MNSSSQEKRKYPRYDTKVKIYFHVNYDIETKVEYQVVDQEKQKILPQKYSALSRNVSAEGLCFTSDQQLQPGTLLYLEVYVPKAQEPVYMNGEVRWSTLSSVKSKGTKKFDTGVRLMMVNGIPVANSIYFDEKHGVVWSVVLDSILGNFRILAHQDRATPKKKT